MSDPALSMMADFNKLRAITISKNAPISDAEITMKSCGIHMLLVIDNSAQVVGLITSEDLLGSKPVQLAQENHLARNEIKIHLVMTPINQAAAIEYNELAHAHLSNVVATMKQAKQHYALAVEKGTDGQLVIRGLFSLAHISRHAGINLLNDRQFADSLAELQQKIG